MSIARYIREIGRGRDGARSLDLAGAHDLMSQVLDRRVTDLEIGAFVLAMRIKGESVAELVGFLGAAQERCVPIHSDRPTIVLPSYNGSRRIPNLTALLAMLLAERDVRVLVHGNLHDPKRVTTAEIFHDLGLTCAAQRARDRGRLEPARAGVHRHRRALPAARPADRRAPARRLAQLGPHRRQAARRLQRRPDAARRQLHPSRIRHPAGRVRRRRPGPTCC